MEENTEQWNEVLGMTPKGTCLRHTNCPVWVHETVVSCRICYAEEKSAGLKQRKTFTAVVQQLQKNSQHSAQSEDNAPTINVMALLQQPAAVESLLKRLSQVQNWSMRQKEKEILSLQLQIHQLEQQRADAEQTCTEQSQTIRALRRTIQQDMKLIKTMATQKQIELEQQEAETDDDDDDEGKSPMRLPRNLQTPVSGKPSPADSSIGSSHSAAHKDSRLQSHMKMFQKAAAVSDPSTTPDQRGASTYWNDNDVSLASNPTKLFASFRGGLLDIPKSPPPPTHATKSNDASKKIQITSSDLSSLQIPANSIRGNPRGAPPPERGVNRFLSGEPTDFAPMVNPPPLRKGKRKPKAKLSLTKSPEVAVEDKEIPIDMLAESLTALPLSRKLDQASPEQLFTQPVKVEGLPPIKSLEKGALASHFEKHSPSSSGGKAPPRMPSNLGKGLPLSSMHSGQTETVAEPILDPPPQSALAKKLAEARQYNDDELGQTTIATNDMMDNISFITGETGPTFFEESTHVSVDTNFTMNTGSGEKFIFKVTRAECHDKYGDKGMYSGTVLVTEGLPHGNGTMNYESGRMYSGDWVSGQWNGSGKLLNPNGDVYEGEFVMDARHGKGVYKWDNGDVYTGMFREDKRHGQGKFCFHNGNVYDGDFCDGMFDGFGKYKFSGGYYEGEWKEGKYHGTGDLLYASGGKYSGEFRNSVAHGFGMEESADGEKRRGVWEHGQPVESCK